MRIYEQSHNDNLDIDKYNIPPFFITGPPGIGKSYLIMTLNKMAILTSYPAKLPKGLLRTTFTGTSAVGIGGFTCFALRFSPTITDEGFGFKTLDEQEIFDLQNTFHINSDSYCGFALDEFPTLRPIYLYAIMSQLEQLFGKNGNKCQ